MAASISASADLTSAQAAAGPSAHRRYGKWTPGGLIAAGERIGPSTAAFFQAVIAARPHPEQGFRTSLGILSLARSYSNVRVDAACRRGILIKARSVASIRSILKNGLDRAFLDDALDHQPLRHGNIRGQGYFH
jgi:transposase